MNKKEALKIVEKDGLALEDLDDSLKNDPAILAILNKKKK